mgnify:CR=1 FL=1
MSTKVRAARWGNSIAVRLPRRAVEALGITAGQDMKLEVKGRTVELTLPQPAPAPVTIQWILAEMDRLGPDAEPETVDWGPDVGSEIIHDDYSPG